MVQFNLSPRRASPELNLFQTPKLTANELGRNSLGAKRCQTISLSLFDDIFNILKGVSNVETKNAYTN